MAKARRNRGWLVWLSAAGLGLTLAAAAVSELGAVSWREDTGGVASRLILYRSSVTVIYRSSPDDVQRLGREVFPAGWSYMRRLPADMFERSWAPAFARHTGGLVDTWHGVLPLWMPAAIFGAGLWWGLRGGWIGAGACRKCGYDVRGVVGGRCPECGAGIGESTPAAVRRMP